jgi:hypothetical protein
MSSPNISTRRAGWCWATAACCLRSRSSRIEVRRLTDWFNRKFYEEVSQLSGAEKVHKRFMPPEAGGGAPEGAILRAARTNVRYHLKYLGHLLGQRNWLAGDRLSHADLAAAAHLSVCDFLGDVPWEEDENGKAMVRPAEVAPLVPPAAGRPGAGHDPERALHGSRLLSRDAWRTDPRPGRINSALTPYRVCAGRRHAAWCNNGLGWLADGTMATWRGWPSGRSGAPAPTVMWPRCAASVMLGMNYGGTSIR